MTVDDELDPRVRARLRDHFDRAVAVRAIPDFDAMLAAAESAARPAHHRRWIALSGALAASLAVVMLLWGLRQPDLDAPLVAELSSTTHWIAPSDHWPTPRSSYLGLPRFDGMNNETNSDMNSDTDEVQTWF
jgi:hypothetical protein